MTFITDITINKAKFSGELSVQVHPIETSSSTSILPDPNWEEFDSNNHFHAFTSEGKLPTLNESTEGADADEEPGDHRWRCSICAEEVFPRWLSTGDWRTFKAGRKTWELVVYDTPSGAVKSLVGGLTLPLTNHTRSPGLAAVQILTPPTMLFGVAGLIDVSRIGSARFIGINELGERRIIESTT